MENQENHQTCLETMNLGPQPGDADQMTMQEQDPVIQIIWELVMDPQRQPSSLQASKDLKALSQVQNHL